MANERAKRTAAIARSSVMFGAGKLRPRKMPKQALPTAIEREYGRALSALVSRATIRAAFAQLLAELPALIESARRERGDARIDADEGKRARALVAAAKQRLQSAVSTSAIEALAEQFAEKTSTWQRIQLNRQTKAALGVDVFANDRNLRNRVANFASENVSLIKGITDDVASRVEKTVTRALTSATLHPDLAETLEEQFGYGEKRAQLIARDQVGKLYGQINATRQQELGVERFTWRSTNDERTRDSHSEFNGNVYRYDDPPTNERGEAVLPGEDILCRCWAEPLISDILDEGTLPEDAKALSPDGSERIVSARELTSRGYFEPEAGLDQVKLEKARRSIREGQRDPVRITVGPDGTYELSDGRHRLRAAAEAGVDVKVLFERGPSAGKGRGLIQVGGRK